MFDNIDLNNLDLNKIMGDMQQKAKEMQEQSELKTYSSKSGGGMVEAKVNGNMQLIDLNIDDELLDDKDSLSILLISAINEALLMADTDKKNSALGMLGGINPFENL